MTSGITTRTASKHTFLMCSCPNRPSSSRPWTRSARPPSRRNTGRRSPGLGVLAFGLPTPWSTNVAVPVPTAWLNYCSNLTCNLGPVSWAMRSHTKDVAKNVKRSATAAGLSRAGGSGDEEELRKAPNAERDLHRFFRRAGLSMPMPISSMVHNFDDGESLTLSHVRLVDWLRVLIAKYPELLAGGNSPVEEQLLGFWDLYRHLHPTHEVYARHAGQLHCVWPLLFFGDEGRGPKRSQFMEATIESPLGLSELSEKDTQCNCRGQAGVPHAWLPRFPQEVGNSNHACAVERVATNYTGHSFLTRFLLFGLPAFLYEGRPDIIKNHLKAVSDDLKQLFEDGIQIQGRTHYAALVGSKGDFKFQAFTVGNLTRSYAHLKGQNGMCSLCKAGTSEHSFEDVQPEPSWAQSMFAERPWNANIPPVFAGVPYDNSCPERMFQLDCFHIFKLGVGRDLAGSVLWLCRLGAFDFERAESRRIGERLKRAHGMFALWCSANHRKPGLRSFTTFFFQATTQASAPWANSKGSDTMLLLQWLDFQLSLCLRDPSDTIAPHFDILMLLQTVLQASLALFTEIYQHGVFISRDCGLRQYGQIMTIIRGYKRLAHYCASIGVSAYRLKPKLHALHHLAYDLRRGLESPAPKLLNMLTFACEMNEDHTGRTSRLSRKVNTKTLTKRLFERYFLKTKALIRRHFASKKRQKALRKG